MRKLKMNAGQRWATDKASDQSSLCYKEVVKIDVESLKESRTDLVVGGISPSVHHFRTRV